MTFQSQEEVTNNAPPPYKLRNEMERAVWAYLTKHPKVTYADLQSVHSSTIHDLRLFWGRLRTSGVLRECGRVGRTNYYTIMAPSDAEALHKASRLSTDGAIWTAMRVHREFSPDDLLASLAGPQNTISLRQIRTYCHRLTKSGYLRVLRKHIEGKRSARYKLIRNTGPLPPEVRRRLVIIDQNEDRAVYVEGAQL